MKRRFESHLKRNLVQIENNVYINKVDTHYYDKLSRFYKEPSPDAHLLLGYKNEKAGQYEKALYHFEAAAKVPFPKSEEAWRAYQRMKRKVGGNSKGPNTLHQWKPSLLKKIVYGLVIVAASCILTITLLLLES